MGVVYKARQKGLNRLVALKMLRAGLDAEPRELARFRAEAEAVARLQHPNIVQIHEIGEAAGRPYFCLELVDGGSLADRLRGQMVRPEEAAGLIEVLAQAMHAAHQRGLVHRDLKPGNILLTAAGTPKVADFGLAKQLDRNLAHTQSGAVLGTPSYMAPEQAAGRSREIGPTTDVYALGAILYEMLTGRPPFKGESLMETLDQVRWQPPVPPGRIQPGVPEDLEAICLKCLEKDRADRYATAALLAEDLRRFLAGQTVQAPAVPRDDSTESETPPGGSVGPMVGRFLRRRWAAILVCCLVSVGVALYLGPRFRSYAWRVNASLEYRPRELQHGPQRLYSPQDFATVLNVVKARSNFDKLVHGTALAGVDTYLLANNIFRISQAPGPDANIIQITVDWEDPAEAVEIVSRLLAISQERLRQERRSVLDDIYRHQKQILDRKQAELKKAQQDKAEPSPADLQAFKGSREAILAQIDAEKGNLSVAEKALSRAESEQRQTEMLLKAGARSQAEAKESQHQVILARDRVAGCKRALERLQKSLAELRPGVESQLKAIANAEKERNEQSALVEAIRDFRDNNFDELRIIDPAQASLYPVRSTEKKVTILAFLLSMAALLPLVVVYDWARRRTRGRGSSSEPAGDEGPDS
jgi:serine/threonine protein kinase